MNGVENVVEGLNKGSFGVKEDEVGADAAGNLLV